MKIRKNDQVKIIAGKDRGKQGKILRVVSKGNKVVVEGLNIIKKHAKPKRGKEKGQRIEIPAPLDVSKVMIICPSCGKVARLGFKSSDGKKLRICKKCKAEI